MKFIKYIVGLHFFIIILSILAKFHDDQKSIALSSIKHLNFKFL